MPTKKSRDQRRAEYIARQQRAESYGVREENPLPFELAEVIHNRKLDRVDWTDPDLARIVRFRMISDPGFPVWDISYCVGQTRDGELVDVDLPFHQLPKRGWKRALVGEAIEAGVNAKRLGFFDAVSTLN